MHYGKLGEIVFGSTDFRDGDGLLSLEYGNPPEDKKLFCRRNALIKPIGILLFGLLLILLSSCGKDQSQVEPTLLKFAFHQRDEEHYRALAEQFEAEHPFIKIELVFGNNSFLNNLQPEDADVLAVSTNQMRRMMS